MSNPNASQISQTTEEVFKAFLLTAGPAVSGFLADKIIQLSRNIDAGSTKTGNPECDEIIKELLKAKEPVKNEIKNTASFLSSFASAVALAISAGGLINALVQNGSKLTRKQGLTILAVCLPALAGIGVSVYNFGVEQTTESSGYIAATSALLLNSAKGFTLFFAARNKPAEQQPLLQPAEQPTSVTAPTA